MSEELINLVAANLAFVGSHFLMAHPLRKSMLSMFGNIGFPLVYSLISLATLAWIYFAFKAAPASDLSGSGDIGWTIATTITLPAMVLFAGSMANNPAMPTPQAAERARAGPKGVFHITRHPMMWGFALWALSHIVLWWSLRTVVTASAIAILALVGSKLQDSKKREEMGEAWASWESETRFFPQLSGFAKAGAMPWAIGLIFFVFFSWLHSPLGGIPAGIWRWF